MRRLITASGTGFNTAQLNALTDVAADDAPAAGNALKFSDIASGEDIDIWLGKDAEREHVRGVVYAIGATGLMPFAVAV